MNHKEMTAHIRNRIKAAGIKARVKMQSEGVVAVDVPAFNVIFSDDEQRKIRLIAQVNRLTWVRSMPININQMTNPQEFKFYIPS